ncbi:MAG: bifunctional folylpolyglutamate synthase/dihydrofolate synthase [Deltaproteobacteria bacterium]|nr:bifunctional folylpolyglutamate synthase/dihydrofolate synthase [Deltaproteobacteria bacterium]MBW2122383.1 bifunctional folylpolyglutamate synthase/dihydrofolate synthase [Deltaproteobacteria bacterium]
MESSDFVESLAYLYGLQRFGMVFGLSNIENILRALGNPHETLKVVHVGGTNGKGSTAAIIASVLRENGHRVGLYTSPHVLSFTERIQIDGRPISESEVARLTWRMKGEIERARVPERFTFFDFTTAMAFLYFAESEVDLAVVEVGLGGRLDSTNVVSPLIAVITNISREHQEVLGNSLREIAGEKGGIIKAGVPLVTGVAGEETLPVLEEICSEKDAPLYRAGRDFRGERVGAGIFHFHGRHWELSELKLNLLGEHQIDNATLALATLERMEGGGLSITRESIYRGLERVNWPGRLEVAREKPWVVLDGAHNPAAAVALRDALSRNFSYHRCYLLLGIMKDKEVERIVSILAPLSDLTVVCKPRQDRAAAPERLMKALETAGAKGQIVPDVAEGLDALLSMAGSDDLICATGSFYTIGEAKAHLSGG